MNQQAKVSKIVSRIASLFSFMRLPLRVKLVLQIRGENLALEIPLLSLLVHLETSPSGLDALFHAYARLFGAVEANGRVDSSLVDQLYATGGKLCLPAHKGGKGAKPAPTPKLPAPPVPVFDLPLHAEQDFAL